MLKNNKIKFYGKQLPKAGITSLILNKGAASHFVAYESQFISPAAITQIIKWSSVTVAGLGAFDAVSGATQIKQIAPSAGSSTVPAKAGELLNLVYQVTGAPSRAKSWAVIGELPPGLTHLNSTNSNTDGITGTPTESGNYTVKVRAYEKKNRGGGKKTKTFTIEIAPGAQPPAISTHPLSLTTTSVREETLQVIAIGNGLKYQWYKGNSGDTSAPISGANIESLIIGPLDEDTSYWVRISNDSGFIDSKTANLEVLDDYDSWASETFGAVNINPELTAPDKDADDDGLTNEIEYILGNSPIKQSIDSETTLRLQNSKLEVSFQTEPAAGKGYIGLERAYSLEESSDISKGSWTPVQGHQNIIGNGQEITISTNLSDKTKYYRLNVELREKS